LQQRAQRLAPGVGAHEVLAEVGEDGFEGEELVGTVVDEEDVDLLVGGGGVDRIRRHQPALLDRGYITPPCGRCARRGLRTRPRGGRTAPSPWPRGPGSRSGRGSGRRAGAPAPAAAG